MFPHPGHRGDTHERPRRAGVRARRLLAWGSLVTAAAVLTAGVTAPAFTDGEWASLGGTTGIGTGAFDLRFSSAGHPSSWVEAPEGEPVAMDLPSNAELVPGGGRVEGAVWVRNAGDYRSSLEVAVDATASQALLDLLTVTATAQGGAPVPVSPDGAAVRLPDLAAGQTVKVTFSFDLAQTGNRLSDSALDITAEFTGRSIPPPGGE